MSDRAGDGEEKRIIIENAIQDDETLRLSPLRGLSPAPRDNHVGVPTIVVQWLPTVLGAGATSPTKSSPHPMRETTRLGSVEGVKAYSTTTTPLHSPSVERKRGSPSPSHPHTILRFPVGGGGGVMSPSKSEAERDAIIECVAAEQNEMQEKERALQRTETSHADAASAAGRAGIPHTLSKYSEVPLFPEPDETECSLPLVDPRSIAAKHEVPIMRGEISLLSHHNLQAPETASVAYLKIRHHTVRRRRPGESGKVVGCWLSGKDSGCMNEEDLLSRLAGAGFSEAGGALAFTQHHHHQAQQQSGGLGLPRTEPSVPNNIMAAPAKASHPSQAHFLLMDPFDVSQKLDLTRAELLCVMKRVGAARLGIACDQSGLYHAGERMLQKMPSGCKRVCDLLPHKPAADCSANARGRDAKAGVQVSGAQKGDPLLASLLPSGSLPASGVFPRHRHTTRLDDTVSTGMKTLDSALHGGLQCGFVTELSTNSSECSTNVLLNWAITACLEGHTCHTSQYAKPVSARKSARKDRPVRAGQAGHKAATCDGRNTTCVLWIDADGTFSAKRAACLIRQRVAASFRSSESNSPAAAGTKTSVPYRAEDSESEELWSSQSDTKSSDELSADDVLRPHQRGRQKRPREGKVTKRKRLRGCKGRLSVSSPSKPSLGASSDMREKESKHCDAADEREAAIGRCVECIMSAFRVVSLRTMKEMEDASDSLEKVLASNSNCRLVVIDSITTLIHRSFSNGGVTHPTGSGRGPAWNAARWGGGERGAWSRGSNGGGYANGIAPLPPANVIRHDALIAQLQRWKQIAQRHHVALVFSNFLSESALKSAGEREVFSPDMSSLSAPPSTMTEEPSSSDRVRIYQRPQSPAANWRGTWGNLFGSSRTSSASNLDEDDFTRDGTQQLTSGSMFPGSTLGSRYSNNSSNLSISAARYGDWGNTFFHAVNVRLELRYGPVASRSNTRQVVAYFAREQRKCKPILGYAFAAEIRIAKSPLAAAHRVAVFFDGSAFLGDTLILNGGLVSPAGNNMGGALGALSVPPCEGVIPRGKFLIDTFVGDGAEMLNVFDCLKTPRFFGSWN